jgi:hypothetical protein
MAKKPKKPPAEEAIKEEPAQYAAPTTQPKKNMQYTPDQIDGWVPFWMVYVAGKHRPRKKYLNLAEACRDATALCTINGRKVFVLEPIGIFIHPEDDKNKIKEIP